MQIFREAGLPDGVINFVPGPPELVSEVLLNHPLLGGKCCGECWRCGLVCVFCNTFFIIIFLSLLLPHPLPLLSHRCSFYWFDTCVSANLEDSGQQNRVLQILPQTSGRDRYRVVIVAAVVGCQCHGLFKSGMLDHNCTQLQERLCCVLKN